MRFAYALALGIALLVAVPYLAHRLRRRKAEERPFPAAALVPAAPPQARRRAALEDRALFGVRALAVLALALLGALPLVRCSRLSLSRPGGASVALAIVLDDSMSMRAKDRRSSRFERARTLARELLASTREGDAVALVLAGAPARVALAPTTDLGAARGAIDAVTESDRGTDLDGALAVARSLVGGLPQVDRRVVILSDLADGHSDGPPLGEGSGTNLWVVPLGAEPAPQDCGVVEADRTGPRIRVHVACGFGGTAAGRDVVLRSVANDGADKEGKELARAPAPPGADGFVTLTAPADNLGELVVALSGADVIASDDKASVIVESTPGAVAVVAELGGDTARGGGAPVVEQALGALELRVPVRPLPVLPDRAEELSSYAGVILDDPPGLTPEQRRGLTAFLENGGIVLVALGPRAAAASLGSSLSPLLSRAPTWVPAAVPGADPVRASSPLVEAAASWVELGAQGRALLAREDTLALEMILPWKDGAPLVARRIMGRGEAWFVTLPFALDLSDMTLRPAFLALLDGWMAEVRARRAPRRTDVGVPWTFTGTNRVEVTGPLGPVKVDEERNPPSVTPALVGRYALDVDGRKEVRVVRPRVREMDLRPRPVVPSARGEGVGDTQTRVDVSWLIALVLLALVCAEMGLRVVIGRASPAT